jgi:hypothetical protein
MKRLGALLAAVVAAGFLGTPAFAAGMFPGYPAATTITGTENIPADTGLANGQSPQTELITPNQLKNFAFSNTAAGTATATGTTTATATLNAGRGVITSAALTTAAAGTYVLTLTNSAILAGSVVLASVGYGTATTGSPAITHVDVSAGSVVINVQNLHASAALNGTIKIDFVVVN